MIGVALLFQYNLKLNKLAQVRWIEDINDEEEQEEQEIGPIALMQDIFPFNEKPVSHIVTKTVYVRSKDDPAERLNTNPLSYVRSTEVMINENAIEQDCPRPGEIETKMPMLRNFKKNSSKDLETALIPNVVIEIPEKAAEVKVKVIHKGPVNPKKVDIETESRLRTGTGEIESDSTEDDSASYQESNKSDGFSLPALPSVSSWRPPAGHLRLPNHNLRQ